MSLLDNHKKKKIIEQINNIRNIKIDNSVLNEYGYEVLKQLDSADYYLINSQLIELLQIIKTVGHKLINVDIYSFYFYSIKTIINSREDYEYLDILCKDIKIEQIDDYIIRNNNKDIKTITVDIINDFYNAKEEKSTAKKVIIESDVPSEYRNSFIDSVVEANHYISLYHFLKEKNENLISLISTNDYLKIKKLICNIDSMALSEVDKENLLDYLEIKFYHNDIQIDVNSIDDLNDYKRLKRDAIVKYHTGNKDIKDIKGLLYLVDNIKNADELYYGILLVCNNLSKLLEGDITIFNEKEIELLSLLSRLQNNDNLDEIFGEYLNKDIDFNDISINEFKNKIRVLYGKDIANSLTSLDSLSTKETIGNVDDNIPIYQINGDKFNFLSHSITKSGGPNIAIKNRVEEGKTFFNNPELWNELPKEYGTNALSTSYMSSNGIAILYSTVNNTVFYGFDNLDPNSIRNISPSDGSTSHTTDNFEAYGGGREEMYLSEDLVKHTFLQNAYEYNEVAINRYNGEKRKTPDFIICFDKTNEASIKHAKYFNIPILIIKTQTYLDNFKEELTGSFERLSNCDKNDTYNYYNRLLWYYSNLLKYSRVPYTGEQNRIQISVEQIKNIEIELDELKSQLINTDKNQVR